MRLVHYSAAPFALDRTRVYRQRRHFLKPTGLWVSVEDAADDDQTWHSWCVREAFGLERLAHQAVLELVPEANVRHLGTIVELLRFTSEFRKPDPTTELHAIDWPRVQRTYGGLIIAPYQWSARLDLLWYYVWDCASACLWDLTTIHAAITVEGS